MTKREKGLIKSAGSHPRETKTGVQPKQSGNAADALPKAEQEAEREACRFPVVGIGASAGGLAAFETFFSGMPADSEPGIAFAVRGLGRFLPPMTAIDAALDVTGQQGRERTDAGANGTLPSENSGGNR